MSKYNANGGQRRSSKSKIGIPSLDAKVKCRLCDAWERRVSAALSDWEMQHMHFSDGELEFMTCPKCKTMNPIEMLEKIGVEI